MESCAYCSSPSDYGQLDLLITCPWLTLQAHTLSTFKQWLAALNKLWLQVRVFYKGRKGTIDFPDVKLTCCQSLKARSGRQILSQWRIIARWEAISKSRGYLVCKYNVDNWALSRKKKHRVNVENACLKNCDDLLKTQTLKEPIKQDGNWKNSN